jgi:xanthine dehydrogenase accessory factor
MDSLDLEVLTRARDWLSAGHRVVLATVVRTWGSSPRPPGALLALRDDGRAVGSVSGGCIEDDLMHRLRRDGHADRRRMS